MQRIKSILKKIGSKNGVRLMFLSVYVFGFAIPAGYAYFAAYPAKKPSSPMRERRISSIESSAATC